MKFILTVLFSFSLIAELNAYTLSNITYRRYFSDTPEEYFTVAGLDLYVFKFDPQLSFIDHQLDSMGFELVREMRKFDFVFGFNKKIGEFNDGIFNVEITYKFYEPKSWWKK